MGERVRQPVFKFQPFSDKQVKILTWWMNVSPVHDYEGIIADGAIRSGKTLSMSLSFVMWAMETFDNQNLGMCGRTIGSFRRNVMFWLKLMLKSRGYGVADHRADNLLIVTRNGKSNYFYVFGGKDERSQDLIQGITLAGILFDEVALMPESFVNQATGRCSVTGSKFWFNCNPEGPQHWFKKNWIDKRGDKTLLYLHFTMEDNLSLAEEIKQRYQAMYTGVFYDRFIRGLWVVAEGLIYPDAAEGKYNVPDDPKRKYMQYYVSIDYGTLNPCSMGLWGLSGDVWYRIKEYYHSGRDTRRQLTDEEYYTELDTLAGGLPVSSVIIDPSAASFIATIRKHGRFSVRPANNEVVDGIRATAAAMQAGKVKICECCTNTIAEFSAYRWDEKAAEDRPIKESDHAMDDIRYFVNTVLGSSLGVVRLGR